MSSVNDMNQIVIIGASHAAIEATAALRKFGCGQKIVIIGDENVIPYQRPPLSKQYLNSDLSEEKLYLRKANYYAENNIELKLGKAATLINRQAQIVRTEDGIEYPYSKLIISTGTRARTLSVSGIEQVDALYLRSILDAEKIKNKLVNAQRMVIVGAGYIGLELAASAITMGIEVTVLEAMDRVLARVAGEEIANYFTEAHRKQGVNIILGARIDEIKDSTVYLEDEKVIPFDILVVGIGVTPNSEIAERAGLRCENGVKVGNNCRTEDPNIFAIGDVSNFFDECYQRHVRLESVPNAVAQAKVAAANICGLKSTLNAIPWFWSNQFKIRLQTAGLLQGYDRTEVTGDTNENKFSVRYFKGDRLLAVDAINSPAEFLRAQKELKTLSNRKS